MAREIVLPIMPHSERSKPEHWFGMSQATRSSDGMSLGLRGCGGGGPAALTSTRSILPHLRFLNLTIERING